MLNLHSVIVAFSLLLGCILFAQHLLGEKHLLRVYGDAQTVVATLIEMSKT